VTSVQVLCVAVSTELDQLESRGPVGQVRGLRTGISGGQRGHASALGIHECACACEPGDCHVHAVASELQH